MVEAESNEENGLVVGKKAALRLRLTDIECAGSYSLLNREVEIRHSSAVAHERIR